MTAIKTAILARFKDKGVDGLCFVHSIDPSQDSRFNTVDTFAVIIAEDVLTRELLDYVTYFEVETNRYASFKHAKTDFATDNGQLDKIIIFLTVEKGCN